MTNIVLFGPPGSGKGTQAQHLVEKFNLCHISTGDLFRFNFKNDTKLGKLAKSFMDKGNLVPDEVTIAMLRDKVLSMKGVEGFIFDGFPRTINQADSLKDLMVEIQSQVDGLILLEVEEEEIVNRLLDRGKTSGRKDDQNEETIRKRIKVYEADTSPVFDYYDKLNNAYTVNGLGTVEEIFNRLNALVEHIQDAS